MARIEVQMTGLATGQITDPEGWQRQSKAPSNRDNWLVTQPATNGIQAWPPLRAAHLPAAAPKASISTPTRHTVTRSQMAKWTATRHPQKVEDKSGLSDSCLCNGQRPHKGPCKHHTVLPRTRGDTEAEA